MKNESEEIEMLNNLDLMIIVFMVLAAAGLLALVLMFLVRNEKIKKASLYITSALGLYVGYISFRIFWPMFIGQFAIGVILAAAAIAAIVLSITAKDNIKKFKIARILAAASLVLGMINAAL